MKKLLLALTLVACGSCIKAPKLSSDLGPQATDEDMERAISKALYGVDPFSTAKGQQVVYFINARVENQEKTEPLKLLTQTVMGLTITSKNGETTKEETLKITVDQYTVDLQDQSRDREERSEEYVRHRPLSPLVHLPQLIDSKLTKLKRNSLSTRGERPVLKYTYHNLRESSGVQAPPADVVSRPNCGGVPNCQLSVKQLSYDEARWYSDREYEVEQWQFTIAKDAPFLAHIIEFCVGALYPINGGNYFIKQCQFARDFHYRDALPPQ